MGKVQFDPDEEGGLELARSIVLDRLRTDGDWKQYDLDGTGFSLFVDYVGDSQRGRQRLTTLAQDVLWELMIQGVIAPGLNLHTPNLPWFHLTEYGTKVLEAREFLPHDPTGYMDRFRAQCSPIDATVEVYLKESLNCFSRGALIAAIVMLGVASERVFLVLCEAFVPALQDPGQKAKLEKELELRAIKPKMDWVIQKIGEIQARKPRPLPDNINVMLAAVFDFIRCQRNELGHPQPVPPVVTREEAFANLRIFPSYYTITQQVVEFLAHNKV